MYRANRCLDSPAILLLIAFGSQVGCVSLLGGTYTLDQAHQEVIAIVPTLPVAELIPGAGQEDTSRVIVLRGKNSLFSSLPLSDPKWLNDKMTQEEYTASIASINEAVAQSFVGLTRAYSPDDIPARRARMADAASNQVTEINKTWAAKGVTFTFQGQDQHDVLVDLYGDETKHWRDSVVYLRID